MRLQELRHLEWADVDLDRNEIHIRQEKMVESIARIAITDEKSAALGKLNESGFSALSLHERKNLLGHRFLSAKNLQSLRYDDFDFQNKVLILKSFTQWNPKSTGRVVPISPSLRALLIKLPRISNLVFPDPHCGGLWRFDINKLVKACSRHAQISKNIHTHSLRHTFATHLRRRGVALETIKELLGHADIRGNAESTRSSPRSEALPQFLKIDFFEQGP